MAPVILIGSVTKGREKSAANLFAALTHLVALAAMGMGAEDPERRSATAAPEIDAGPRKPTRFALGVVKQDSDVRADSPPASSGHGARNCPSVAP